MSLSDTIDDSSDVMIAAIAAERQHEQLMALLAKMSKAIANTGDYKQIGEEIVGNVSQLKSFIEKLSLSLQNNTTSTHLEYLREVT